MLAVVAFLDFWFMPEKYFVGDNLKNILSNFVSNDL
jgi:hypothetical protein